MAKPRALVVDPDQEFLKNLCLDPEADSNPPLFASNGFDAQKMIADKTIRIAGIFINPRIAKPEGISVIRHAHLCRAGTPIYLIFDEKYAGISDDLLKKLAVSKVLKKPIRYKQMLELVQPAIPEFNAFHALELAKRWSDPLDIVLSVDDIHFVPINASDYIAGHKTFFDIYVKLGTGKMIKILQAGDSFDSERISSYLKKGVFTMYIRKDVQADYIAYCDQIVDSILEKKEIPEQIKIKQSLNVGDQILKLLYQRGVDSTVLERATKNVLQIQKSVEDYKMQEHPVINAFLSDLANYDHSVACALVVSMMMKPLGIQANTIQSAIGLGAYLHDVGLGSSAAELEMKKLSEMTREQMVTYYTHPQNGAKILSNLRGVSQLTVSVVLQHHERRDGKGFPGTANAGEISQAAQLVGAADEFVRYVKLMEKDPAVDPILMMSNSADAYSFPIIKAFSQVF